MKKIILSSLLVLAFGFTHAQKAQFGIKGGLNVANFSGDTDGMDLKSRIGFHIGGFVDIKIADKFSFQPELLYSTQGSKFDLVYNEGGTNYNAENTFKLAYINIPVMFKYYATEKFSLEFGPQIGFLLSAKADYTLSGDGGSISDSEDIKDSMESVDFGLNFGAGYDFTKNISAGIRYNLGLSNIFKTEEGDDSKIQNSVFSLSMGYKF